jgi:hypothetical protein
MDVDSSPTLYHHEEYGKNVNPHAPRGSRCADAVSITSYNEWGEGTQIEPAKKKVGYKDYEAAGGPNAYLQMTAQLSQQFRSQVRALSYDTQHEEGHLQEL